MKELDYIIKDDLGVHARPAGLFAKRAGEFKSSVTILKDDNCADAKRMLEIMSLKIKKGDKIKLKINGEDEEKAVSVLGDFMKENM